MDYPKFLLYQTKGKDPLVYNGLRSHQRESRHQICFHGWKNDNKITIFQTCLITLWNPTSLEKNSMKYSLSSVCVTFRCMLADEEKLDSNVIFMEPSKAGHHLLAEESEQE